MRFRWWIVVVVSVVAAFVMIGYSLGQINDRAEEGDSATDYLCAYRGQTIKNLAKWNLFLLNNPEGISGEVIERYITDQERTLEILNKTLDC
jgi:hypothetical protein